MAREEEFRNNSVCSLAMIDSRYFSVSIGDLFEVVSHLRHLDFINLMAYDLHGAWENTTGHNAPLYAHRNAQGYDKQLSLVSQIPLGFLSCVLMEIIAHASRYINNTNTNINNFYRA